MSGLQLTFDRPWYLVLLALLPVLWLFSFRSLAGLGPYRRLFAIAFRTLMFVLVMLALAEVQLLKTSEKLTVIYLLDQSESIPTTQRQAMLQYVVQEVAAHRDRSRGDKAGVIVFGRDARIEVPPFDDDIPFVSLESAVDLRSDATNLEAGLKLAQASFPEDTAKRVVVVTDGCENLGDARSIARGLTDDGIGLDVVPIQVGARGEVQVEKVVLPAEIRKGQPIEARVVLDNLVAPGSEGRGPVKGKLKLFRQVGGREELLNPNSQNVELKPGKSVFSFPHKIDEAAVYTYRAAFTPDDPRDDLMSQNNEATAFTHVRGKGRVLLIEDAEFKGEFDFLVQRMRESNIEVAVQSSDQLFTSLAELQAYDSVVLANVRRASGVDADTVTSFSDAQIRMLVSNTEQFGCGLVMLGGDRSYGAGGWTNTELEKAMPVDFHIKNAKVRAAGALVMIMHASEMAEGNYWQKVIAQEAIKPLGPMDYCGLIHWGPGKEEWLWHADRDKQQGLIPVGEKRRKMLSAVDRMTPGDMPDFEPGMRMALAGFNHPNVNASVKHMIMISDGDPQQPNPATLAKFKQANIKISTVAVGAHGAVGHNTLKSIADATGGKYYVAKNPKALPRIFQIEAGRVAQPLIKELSNVPPRLEYPHEMLSGIQEPLPPLRGFVMTTLKENPLVEVCLESPEPPGHENSAILASWTFGLGRSVAFTTDAGHRWSSDWTQWENYNKFFSQMIRWSMRPTTEDGKFSVASDVKDGKVRVIVTALGQQDEFLNFLNMSGAAVDPDLKSFAVKIEQTAPGRYLGEFEADKAGSYFLTIRPGPGKAPIITGVTVPYSAEFREHETNVALLKQLASLQPKGGEPGQVIEGEMVREQFKKLLAVDTFRQGLAKAKSNQDIWHLVVLVAGCVFFGDVCIRRVAVDFYWIGPALAWLWQRIRRRPREAVADERLERLRSRKAAVTEQLDERRTTTRFEPQMTSGGETAGRDLEEVLQDASGSAPPGPPPPPSQPSLTPVPEEKSYTARLLDAKKKAWKDRDQK
ncbi:MAG: VWA domain-containing protein [Planctomycetota bacterium]|nr:VWA domain-containing protein [Planctomycetota bacterium]